MRRFSIVGTLLVIIALALGFTWLGLRLVGRSFVADGENDGSIPGLSANASITRDQNGVSYIDAATENDAMAALGYAHAQDRLWQMDLMRRAGEGRLSEIFGQPTIEFDKLLRTIGFRRTAHEIVRTMPKRTREALEAYASGVNAFIRDHKGRYAMEFDALGYEPEPWTPEHSVLIVRLLAWELNTGFWTDIVMGDIGRRVDSLRFTQILPYYPTDAPTIVPGGQHPEPLLEQRLAAHVDTTHRDSAAARDSSARRDTSARRPAPGRISRSGTETLPAPDLTDVMDMEQNMRKFMGIDGAHVGSNAWAIAGNRAAGGKPMLANDPHLTFTAPCRWYQAVINYKGNRVAGVTLPGLPFVVIGRNNDIAWGLTSLMADETDFYIEKIDSLKHTTVQVDNGWEKLGLIRDTIRVKDSAGVPMSIRTSRHGPLISDLHPYAHHTVNGRRVADSSSITATTAVAMRWRGADVSQEIAALQGIGTARNLQEFTAAIRLGGIPSLNYIYADRAGTIASIPVARIPIREAAHATYPNPGWDSRYDWKGTVPMEQLPSLVNPARGYVASANNKLANGLGYTVGDLWEDPSRAVRIDELLKDGNNFNTTDFVQMQADLVSPHMLYMVGFLLRAFPDSARQGSAVQLALRKLRMWNGAMVADAPEAAIAAQWLQTTIEMTYRDEMGPDVFRNYVSIAQQPIRAIRYHAMIDSRWFDDITTHGRVETRDDILRKALGHALDSLHARFDTWDINQWKFGAMHTLLFKHQFDTNEKLRGIVDIGPFEIGGASTTLNCAEWDMNQPFKVRLGPSMRQIVDFADTTAFMRSVITSGESGQPLNQFYKNQTVLWSCNGYLALASSSPVGRAVTSVTHLVPANE